DAEHKPSSAPSVKQGVSEARTVGNPGGICSRQDLELAPGCAGGRGHQVSFGRGKSERRAVLDAPAGYRNGHGKARRLSMMAGTIEVKRPRVRGLEQRFESRLLPLFARRTAAVSELLPQLYLLRTRPRRFRACVAWTARPRRAALGLVDRAAANEVTTGV